MSEVDFIVAYFRYLGYKFIDEYSYGNTSIDVYFNFHTEKVSTISVRNTLKGFTPYTAKYQEFLDIQDKDTMRDFKLSLLIES